MKDNPLYYTSWIFSKLDKYALFFLINKNIILLQKCYL